ncbi:MAG: DUF362 domain-containing protein [Lentisphaerae bacterium]|nr:DUF362 domain-containing protein [Lentisphaerota bacterium]
MNRRDFLKTGFLGALAASTIGKTLNAADMIKKQSAFPDMAAIHGGEPEVMWREGIKALGGIERFVKKGAKVVIKPNIAWTQPPEYAANTNPTLVAAIVRDVLKAGAAEVIVFDHSCDNGPDCYRMSGIAEAATGAGANVLHATDKKSYRKVKIANAKAMTEADIFAPVIDCDTFINVPILKHHGGAKMSGAMKNLMGIVWDRRIMHRQGLQQTIPDLTGFRKPDLNVVDAYRMMMDHGPRGGNLRDVALGKFMLISPDPVAVDAAAVKLLKFDEKQVRYLQEAYARKLGEKDLSKLNIQRIEL